METSTLPPMDDLIGNGKYELTYTEVIMDDMTFEVTLPELIDIGVLGRASDIKSVWRQGMKELEDCFQNVLGQMNDTLEGRINEYDRVRG
jgi:hypothetical protein